MSRRKPLTKSDSYSFCESVHATGVSPWHIRKLDEAGKKLGGGITTKSLCGRVKSGWDLSVPFDPDLHHVCPECKTRFEEAEPC